jgi:hypothetical protein
MLILDKSNNQLSNSTLKTRKINLIQIAERRELEKEINCNINNIKHSKDGSQDGILGTHSTS